MYVADSGNNRIEIINTSGSYMGQIGACSSGHCTASTANGSLSAPNSAAVDSGGNIWVADYSNNRVEEFTSAGNYENAIGVGYNSGPSGVYVSGTVGTARSDNGALSSPTDVAIDSHNNIWVVDSVNNRVQEFSNAGAWIGQLGGCTSGTNCTFYTTAGTAGGTQSQTTANTGGFNTPTALAFDPSGNLWVVDGSANNRIEEFTVSYTASPNTVTYSTNLNGLTYAPQALAFDKSGNMWVTTGSNSGSNYKIYEYTLSGGTYTLNPTSYGGSTYFTGTAGGQGIAFDPSYNIWAVDSGGNRVEEFYSGFVTPAKMQVGSCSSGACGTSSANPGFTAPQYIHSGR